MAAAKKRLNTDAMLSELSSGSAFFSQARNEAEQEEEKQSLPEWMRNLQLISIDRIRPGRYQKRTEEAKDHLVYQQLETQMRSDYECDQLRLFLVVMPDPDDSSFYNPSRGGHRRTEIAKRIGVKEILCFVEEAYDAQELLRGTYAENFGRQNLTTIEEGYIYQAAIEDNGWTQEEVAKHLNVPGGRMHVAHCIRSTYYKPDIQAMIYKAPERSKRVASALTRLDSLPDAVEKRAPIIADFLNEKITVDRVEIMVERLLQGKETVPIKEIARTDRIRATRKGFGRYLKEIGNQKPSDEEREELEALSKEIAEILAR